MTPRQRQLARHALGLPNRRHVSYRNAYHAPYCPGVYDDWQAMVDAGLAEAAQAAAPGGLRRFWLTLAGAQAALEPGERLSPEDFNTEETGRCPSST